MKISTKGRYGLKAMLDLAIYSVNDHVALKSIAQRQNISENYLEQVFSILRKAGLVNSVKGPQGGYFLGRDACDITIGEILRSLEGDLSVIAFSDEIVKDNMELCIKNNVWEKINLSINSAVDSITLKDLSDNYKRMELESVPMYYI